MASTVEFPFSSFFRTRGRSDLLQESGMFRSVSVQSNLVAHPDRRFSSRESVLDLPSPATTKRGNGFAKGGPRSAAAKGPDSSGLTALQSSHRNGSYTCLSGSLLSQFKHQLPSARLRGGQSPLTKAALDSVESGRINGCAPPRGGGETMLCVSVPRRSATPDRQYDEEVLAEKCRKTVGSGPTDSSAACSVVVSKIRISVETRGDVTDVESAQAVTPTALSVLLSASPTRVLMLDCRSFVSYNANHISGALNVSCADCISRKRLMCGRAGVGDMISGGEEAKETYREAMEKGAQLMVYDDNTTDFASLPATHPLQVVVTCLQKKGHEAYFLLGGLQAFHASYAQLCSLPTEPLSRPLLYSPTTNIVDCQVDSAVISQILPLLYIGNERDASNRELLDALGITHILNVTSQLPLHFETQGLVYKRLPASDSGNQNLKQYFEDAILFIDEASKQGGKVLVHCQAGVSRSATIAIAYVMARLSMGMLEAFRFVKSRRAIIAPNFNFMGQLLEFESLLGSGELKRLQTSDKAKILPVACV